MNMNNFSKLCADIRNEAGRDAAIDAQEQLDAMQVCYRHIRAYSVETAIRVFGTQDAWERSLSRQAFAIGNKLTEVSALRRAAGFEPSFSLDEIARPIAAGSGIRYTGD